MHFAIDTFPVERFGLITGSRCSPLVPLKNAKSGMVTLAHKLAIEKYFKHYDEFNTWQTEHGVMAETFAFEFYKKNYNSEIQKGKFYVDENIGGSTDAETENEVIDFKCPTSLQKWVEYFTQPLDKSINDQMQLYMLLTGKSKAIVCAYLLETLYMSDNGLTYPVPENKRMVQIELNADSEWVKKFKSNLPFVVEKRDEYFEIIKLKLNNK